jgi:hypothetical protein
MKIDRLPFTSNKYLIELDGCSLNCPHQDQCDYESYLPLTAKITFDKGDVRIKVISDLSSHTKHLSEDELQSFKVESLP